MLYKKRVIGIIFTTLAAIATSNQAIAQDNDSFYILPHLPEQALGDYHTGYIYPSYQNSGQHHTQYQYYAPNYYYQEPQQAYIYLQNDELNRDYIMDMHENDY